MCVCVCVCVCVLSNCITDVVLLNETYLVNLISDNHLNNIVLCGVCLQFIQPCFQFCKSLYTGDIIHQNCTLCISIVTRS